MLRLWNKAKTLEQEVSNKLRLLYNYLRWLSIDVVAGSLILFDFIVTSRDLTPPISVYIELGLSIWIIYTIDHLLDGKETRALYGRHHFHNRFRRRIKILLLIAIAVGIINLFWLPHEILFWGFALGFFALSYLFLSKVFGSIGFKEFTAAIGYGLGIYLYTIVSLGSSLIFFEVFQLFILALCNLLILSVFEEREDLESGFPSLVTLIGKRKVLFVMGMLLILSFGLSLLVLYLTNSLIHLFYLISTSLYLVILVLKQFFKLKERYRILADGVFFISIFF